MLWEVSLHFVGVVGGGGEGWRGKGKRLSVLDLWPPDVSSPFTSGSLWKFQAYNSTVITP